MLIIGLMSGTSVDGIDAALVEIEGEPGSLRWNLRAFHCIAWEPKLRRAILDACRPDTPIQQMLALHVRIGEVFAEVACSLAEKEGIPFAEIDAIASHGQTLWHQPEPFEVAGASITGTLQIGESAVIAARTGCVVVADFRPADMAVGGQGAPLVPFADLLLFSSAVESRALQNIGGIANVTFLPRGGDAESLVAFDTGPGNMLMDALMSLLSDGKEGYDRGGRLASQGKVSQSLLQGVLSESFFSQPPPRSTGREMFGLEFAKSFYRKGLATSLSAADMLATATAVTVESIAQAYERFLLPLASLDRVILGGGGVQNTFLVEQIKERLAPVSISTHQEFGLPDDAKEAVAFAILGYETLHRRPSNLPAATGAKRGAILGKIAYPPLSFL